MSTYYFPSDTEEIETNLYSKLITNIKTKYGSCLVKVLDTNSIAIIQFIANGSLDWLFSFSFCNNRYANGSCKKDLFVLNSVSTTPIRDM